MSKRKNNCLTLNQKIEVIKLSENKTPVKLIQAKFKCGKTQIYEAVKRKTEIKEQWLTSRCESYRTKKLKTGNEEIDKAVFEWFVSARAQLLPISGPILQERAKLVAEKLAINTFKASNGWLESFKKRHRIALKQIGGKPEEANEELVAEWKSKICDLIKDYNPEDVYSCDETGLFFRALPNETYETCVGGKVSKERFTILFCCNLAGAMEKPLVIGKSLKPRCFKNIAPSHLPVIWRANKKAWMTSQLMEEWLIEFNNKMKVSRRNVILFLDDACCHPKITLSNVTLHFLPPYIAGLTQPLDQGIVQNFKCHYRKYVLRSLGNNYAHAPSVSELAGSVSVLDAVMWIGKAVKDITSTTIQKCFIKGVFSSHPNKNDDGYGELDNISLKKLQDIIQQTNIIDISAEEFCNFDEKIACTETAVFDNVEVLLQIEDEMSDDEEVESENNIKSFADAIQSLKNIERFATAINNPSVFIGVHNLRTQIEKDALVFKLNGVKQELITDYL